MEINQNQKISEESLSYNNSYTRHPLYLKIRNICEFAFALTALFVTLPVILLFCLAIKLESKGPAFFFQERVGLNGELFQVIKLRSMNINAEQKGAQWALKNDPRVTKVGAFIRKTRIDELPQLINILRGDMSLIGPRPERLIFTEQFNQTIPGFKERLIIKPGLTGWAQVNGGYDITAEEKLKLDMYYINNISFAVDVKIILKTVKVVFTGEGAR